MPFAFSVREAVSLGAESAGRVNDSLARLDLLAFADRSVLSLSGGERQRVALARAFAQDAPLILLDEPTAHQDLRYAGRVLGEAHGFVREDPARRGVVAVLHDLNLARDWADKVLLLRGGNLFAAGVPEKVLTAEILSEVYGTSVTISPYIRAEGA